MAILSRAKTNVTVVSETVIEMTEVPNADADADAANAKTNITVVSETVIEMTEVPNADADADSDSDSDSDSDADADTKANADADADAVSKLMQLTQGGIGVGTFSAGSTGAAYRDQLLAGAHNQAYVVAFFIGLAVVYLVSVGEMLVAVRWVSLDNPTAGKITFISLLLLLVLVAFGLVSYYQLNNH